MLWSNKNRVAISPSSYVLLPSSCLFFLLHLPTSSVLHPCSWSFLAYPFILLPSSVLMLSTPFFPLHSPLFFRPLPLSRPLLFHSAPHSPHCQHRFFSLSPFPSPSLLLILLILVLILPNVSLSEASELSAKLNKKNAEKAPKAPKIVNVQKRNTRLQERNGKVPFGVSFGERWR